MRGKYRMDDKYRSSDQGSFLPLRESDPPPPSRAKGDMDMRDRDMRVSSDMQPPFSNKDRIQRGKESGPPMPSHSPSFRNEKKDRTLMRDDYNRGDALRRSPDHHGPTLDERFRHSTEKHTESRMHFDREELEKITIDIRRNVREPSPTLRRIINPEEIKVVRRPGEGNRPLFEREEIKKPLLDLREDACFERRISISKKEPGMEDYSLNRKHLMPDLGEMRNREFADSSRQTLSDRWQSYGDRKPNVMRSNRELSEERQHSFKQSSSPSRYRDQEFRDGSMNKNIGRDMPRDMAFADREARYFKPRPIDDDHFSDGSRDMTRPYFDDPGDLRYSLSRRKEDSFSDDQMRPTDRERRDSKSSSRWRDMPKGSLDISSGRYRALQSRQRSRSPRSPMHEREQREGSQERGVDFSQRPDRFKYAPWAEKPEVIPKGPSYYEHDDRGENDMNRRRGRGRILRPRGFRGRIMRGMNRGNFRGRVFRGNMNRGRPFFRRGSGGRSSPHQWEHDLFNKMSPGKNDD